MSNLHFVKVFTQDVELEITVAASTTGYQLFKQVCEIIGIREVWYFGINYSDKHNELAWLDLTKTIVKQTGARRGTIYLKFAIKYFPEDVHAELIFETTQRLFYLNVKESILEGRIECSFETAVLLASYACQVKYGNYDEETMQAGFLSKEKLLPHKVLTKEQYSMSEIENMIIQWYRQHAEMLASDVMLEYLRVTQDLEMYGVTYFPIKNKRGTDILLGVNAAGLTMYSKEDRLSPTLSFPWSEISKVNFRRRKFVITPVDKKTKNLVLYSSHIRYNQRLFSICIGTHELYTRRRLPEPIELQHVRAQAEAERTQRLKERAKLTTAMQANDEAERRIQLLTSDVALVKAEKEQADRQAKELARRVEELEHQLHEESKLRAQLQVAEQRLTKHNKNLVEICEKNEGERKRLMEEKATIENHIFHLQRSVLHSSVKVDRHRAAIAMMSNPSLSSPSTVTMPVVTDSRDRQRRCGVALTSNTTLDQSATSVERAERLMAASHPVSPMAPLPNSYSRVTSLSLTVPQIPKTGSSRTGSDMPSPHSFTSDLAIEDGYQGGHECLDDLSDMELRESPLRQLDETEAQEGLYNGSSEDCNRPSDPFHDCRRYTIYSEFNLEMPNEATSDGQRSGQNSAKHSQYGESFDKIRHGNTKKQVDVFESM